MNFQRKKISISARGLGGMFGIYFRNTPPKNYDQAVDIDLKLFKNFFISCLKMVFILLLLLLRLAFYPSNILIMT